MRTPSKPHPEFTSRPNRSWTASGRLRAAAVAGALSSVGASAAAGCLDRPVSPLEPQTTNQVVFSLRQQKIEKIDLLFMIDNSLSMADKQDMLKRAIPKLVGRLVNPACVSAAGDRVAAASADAECPSGYDREYEPLADIHIGVITSSLAQFGPDRCGSGDGADNSHLVGTLDRGAHIPTYQSRGFLAWDPKGKLNPPGERDAGRLVQGVQDLVSAVGEVGCGYEASLESWYRFLVDPAPVKSYELQPCESDTRKTCIVGSGVDTELLDQRHAFMRDDSLLALVMLTDENDCSFTVGGESWKLASQASLPRGSSACAADPSDACCYSCQGQSPPSGCPSPDPECEKGNLSSVEDQLNLRCFKQKQRYGFEMLQPAQRYVEGLTKTRIRDRAGAEVRNPLFPQATEQRFGRDPSMVLVAGILGVPWQDIATTPEVCDVSASSGGECRSSLPPGAPLTYLTAKQLKTHGRWAMILGDPRVGEQPGDPLMREQVEQRTGAHPITGEPLVAANTGATPTANSINGHEWNIVERDDLQYSCTFPLLTPTDTCASSPCECSKERASASADPYDKPICQEETGEYTPFQRYGRAYPPTRQLEVLAAIGDAAVLASICPKDVSDDDSPSFGYSPAADAIGDRVGDKLSGQCLGRALDVTPDGVSCKVVEAVQAPSCGCDPSRGRRPVAPGVAEVVRGALAQDERCGEPGGVACGDVCLCEIEQTQGQTLKQCLADDQVDGFGWCYIDDTTPGGGRFVKSCPATRRQLLRFVGESTPANGADVFVACRGAAFAD